MSNEHAREFAELAGSQIEDGAIDPFEIKQDKTITGSPADSQVVIGPTVPTSAIQVRTFGDVLLVIEECWEQKTFPFRPEELLTWFKVNIVVLGGVKEGRCRRPLFLVRDGTLANSSILTERRFVEIERKTGSHGESTLYKRTKSSTLERVENLAHFLSARSSL